MANNEEIRPIIIKKIKKKGGGHHGGAWKIAYADFVTAMMAFFLLMWLLGSTSKGDLEGISEYFQNPVKVSLSGGSGAGDATSLIKGGGTDLSRTAGQVKKGDPPQSKPVDLKAAAAAAKAEMEKREAAALQALKERLEAAIAANPSLAQFRNQLLLDITSEGLRIQIVDEKNRPMFALARAELHGYTKEILFEIGKVLNDVPNRISLSGHTDATPYSTGETGYSNWELSADRANASRRALLLGGMNESKIMRVVGLSSAALFNKNDPYDPVNRRISIVVMNKKTEDAINRDNGTIVVPDAQGLEEGLATPAAAAASPGSAAGPGGAPGGVKP